MLEHIFSMKFQHSKNFLPFESSKCLAYNRAWDLSNASFNE